MAEKMASGGRWLLVVAAPREWQAVVEGLTRAGAGAGLAAGVGSGVGSGGGVEVPRAWRLVPLGAAVDGVLSGVGKANAAGAAARVFDASRHAAVVSVGIAGALPGSGLGPGDVVCAGASVFADEGLERPDGATGVAFVDCAGLGFPLGDFAGSAVPVDAGVEAAMVRAGARAGRIATVSTCAGTDARARLVAARTGACAEAMEGAAVGLAAHRLGAAFGEVRVISNSTGDRDAQRWDLPRAFSGLSALAGALGGALSSASSASSVPRPRA